MSDTTRKKMLKARADAASARAREVVEKAIAENREMTDDEKATYDAGIAEMKGLIAALKSDARDQDLIDEARAMADYVGGKTGGKSGQRLSFKGMAAKMADRMMPPVNAFGQKQLAVNGTAVVDQAFTGDPIALGKPAMGLLDVLSVMEYGTPEYAYLRQSVRTNKAAVVAEGAAKPTSVLGLERVAAKLEVVAHLSEPTPVYWFTDTEPLEQFVQDELEYGLQVKVEQLVLAAIAATSGKQAQAFSVSVVETVRKALTKIEVAGYAPAAIVLNPVDFEAVELSVSMSQSVERFGVAFATGLPYEPAARRLFGVPIATTASQAAGTGYVLGQNAVELATDTSGVQIKWSENTNDDFQKNMLRCRVEGRFNTNVYRPLAIVSAAFK